MRPFALLCLLLLATPAAAADEINMLAFANGALVEPVGSNCGSGREAAWLTDGNPSTGWATEKDAKRPVDIVISLPERSAREVDVLVSDQSATAGFSRVASLVSRAQEDGQDFPLDTPVIGRWVKLVVKSSHGTAEYAEIMDVRAYGIQLTSTALPAVSGTDEATGFGTFHLKQEGAQLTGCYEHKEGRVQNRRVELVRQ